MWARKLSLWVIKKFVEGHGNRERQNREMNLNFYILHHFTQSLTPKDILSLTEKLNEIEFRLHQIYSLKSFILHKFSIQAADLIVFFLMTQYIYPCPARPGGN